jgi:CRISPR-associated protein Csd2
MNKAGDTIERATGLLVIEVVNSNPNGDPDRESDPRQRPDGRGEISPVSFKRKLRDLVEEKQGPVWRRLSQDMKLNSEEFGILEHRGRDRKAIEKELKDGTFTRKYWDGRVFGNTFLEEGGPDTVKTGTVQFALGLSVAPIAIERLTNTNKAGVQEGKDRGMAPLGYRIVQHGVYCMPFFVNPTAAVKSGCTATDINLLYCLIPFAYAHTASYVRPFVSIRHAWLVEHNSPLGSCSDFALLDALRPSKKLDAGQPSTSWADYVAPTKLPSALAAKAKPLRDLVEDLEQWKNT